MAPEVLEDDDVLAYAVYRMPATYAAALSALRATATALPGWEPRSLFDVGAGPGTAAWAATRVFPSLEDISLIERDSRMRRVGASLGREDRVISTARWESELNGQADLVIASYSLGEMKPTTSGETLWAAARDALVIVEPGTPTGYEVVIGARRAAIEQGAFVAAPCPHDLECPLLETPAWCHFSQRLPRADLHRSLKDASLSWEDEKFSYVALSRARPSPSPARVIGRPRYGKHLVRLPLCTRSGIERRTVGKRDATYKRARDAAWGDEFD